MDIEKYVEKLKIGGGVFDGLVKGFAGEMELGLRGRAGSLKMLPSYLSPDYGSAAGRRMLAVDIGGTNLRVAAVSFNGGHAPLVESESFKTPGTDGVVSAEEFFDAVAGYLAPIASESGRIGICFSFPCEIGSSLDGRILELDKEVRVCGAEGLYVAEGIRRALARRKLPHGHSMAVTNDAVAALLAGKAAYEGSCGGHIGFILGTGVNCCYAEQCSSIEKSPYLRGRQGRCLINVESGGYSGLPRNRVDIDFDAKTRAPGEQMFEKMTSGAYLGSLFTAYLSDAERAGCFSPRASRLIRKIEAPFETRDIDTFLRFPDGGERVESPLSALFAGEKSDLGAAVLLADAFCERAACFIAASLCAVITGKGLGPSEKNPAVITAEGGVFYKFESLHKKILDRMHGDAERRYGVYCRFQKAENTTLTGAALACLAAI